MAWEVKGNSIKKNPAIFEKIIKIKIDNINIKNLSDLEEAIKFLNKLYNILKKFNIDNNNLPVKKYLLFILKIKIIKNMGIKKYKIKSIAKLLNILFILSFITIKESNGELILNNIITLYYL